MSEVNATSGAGQARTASAGKPKAITAKAKGTGTEIADAMRSNDKTSKKVPQKPVPKVITVTAGAGCSLGYLAEVHHTTVAEIMKLNPDITSPDKIREGQRIKVNHIDTKELEAYEAYQTELSNQRWEAEKAERLKQKIENATASVQQAKEMGYDEYYNFQIDQKTGDVTITLRVDKELGDVRKGLGLPRGHLREKNPKIMEKYSPGHIYDIDNYVRINDWDDVEVKAGEKFILDGNSIHPKKGFFGGRY